MKRYWSSVFHGLVLLCLLQSSAVLAVDKGLLLAAQKMLNQGQSVDALDLLSPHEEEYAGDREYDYLYGLALLDTGEPAAAVFAFQRVLAIQPNFAGARLELARAYYDMGQMDRAQREFLVLKDQSPPKNVSDVIDKYMAAIETRNLKNRQGWRGFVELGLGNDSNVNNASSRDIVQIYSIDPESLKTPSTVISTLGGASYDLPFSIDSKFFFKASINNRANTDASFSSSVNYDALIGYNKSFTNNNDISLALQFYTADVDGSFNNKGVNLTGQYNLNFSAVNQMGLFLRAGKVDYESDFNEKDIDQVITGISWAHVFSGPSRVSMVLAAILGRDNAAQNSSPYGRDYAGLRVSAAYPITHRSNVYASIGATDSDYTGCITTSCPGNRTDTQTDVQLGASWRINKTWLLNAVVGRTDNSSNDEIFDYDKNIIMFTARSEFTP